MYKVSVIIPVYNAEKTLRKCVESLVYGIEKDIEIYQEGIGDREGPGGEEPVQEKDFETLRREKLAMLAGVR